MKTVKRATASQQAQRAPEPAERPRLTRYELEIMDVVWRRHEATVHEVCEGLLRPLAYTTVMTTLRLLESKTRVLERTKRGRAFVYRPLVTRNEVSRSILSDLRCVLFGGSVPSLVLNLVAEEALAADDIVTLVRSLKKLEQDM
ncbi:MAG: BlaI/MecI/CopY family transcriptional regulator [Planctomycetaceae bacterium]